MKYARIVAEFYSRAWAIREETLLAMQELLRLQAFAGMKWSEEEIRARIAEANAANGYEGHDHPGFQFLAAKGANAGSLDARGARDGKSGSGTVALIPIIGIISHRMNMMGDISGPGGTSIEKLTAQFRQAMNDGNCKAIVFDVDSPGGSVEGVPELAAEIFNARKQKPITAVVNSLCASAAYWLASAAGEMVCTPSGQSGSIGVYMMHQDESEALKKDGIKLTVIKAGKYKTEGNPSEPLSDEARAAFQSKVDDYYSMFVKGVAQNRGTTQAKVRDGYGQGRTLLAQDAVKQNLVDRVATLDEVLEKHGVVGKGGARVSVPAASSASAQIPGVSAASLPVEEPDDEDEDDLCECKCEQCAAGNHVECSDQECADPNCDHEVAGKASDSARFQAIRDAQALATAKEQTETAAAAGDWLRRIESRRRQMQLL